MASIALDKVILISMIFESLLYGSRCKSLGSCLITNKLGLGIFTVMFGFTLWVLIQERGGQINMRLLLSTLALYALATVVSHLMESMHQIIHLLHQAFYYRCILKCEGFHHIPRCTRWPYRLSQKFIEYEQPHQKFVLCSTNSVGRFLLGEKI